MQKLASTKPFNDGFQIRGSLLDDSATNEAVATMMEVFESCLGPHGQCKLIHNGLGGHVTVTSSSERLLRTTQTSSPVLKLIIVGVQQHLAVFSDGGAMAVTLALQIILRARKLDINRHLATEIINVVTQECIGFLHSDGCASRFRLSLDNLDHLLKIVHGITSTKAACCTSRKETEHIDRCIVKTFLKTFQNNLNSSDERVRYLCVEGKSVKDSYVIDGLVVEAINIPTNSQSAPRVKFLNDGLKSGQILTAVFNISLAGDMEDMIDVVFEASHESQVQDAVLEQILAMGADLIKLGVGAVFCQKVMHPKLKLLLKENGILPVDRLGIMLIKQVHDLAGGKLLASTLEPLHVNDFGYINSIAHRVINNRSYLHLLSSDANVSGCTFVLCGSSEEPLTELKHVCSVGYHVLRQSVAAGVVLKGGGLWQLELSRHLKALSLETLIDWSSSLECSMLQIRIVVHMLAECFERLYDVIVKGPTDKYGGEELKDVDVQQTAVVLDAFEPSSNAVRTAMFLSSMVLSIHRYILNSN